MNRTFRPRLEQLEQHVTPSVEPLPGTSIPDGVNLGSDTATFATDALDADTFGVALSFLVAKHRQAGAGGNG